MYTCYCNDCDREMRRTEAEKHVKDFPDHEVEQDGYDEIEEDRWHYDSPSLEDQGLSLGSYGD
jgi:hypothetical protein